MSDPAICPACGVPLPATGPPGPCPGCQSPSDPALVEPLPNPLLAKSEAQVKEQMRGFPTAAIEAVLRLRQHFDARHLRETVLAVLEFYLPKAEARSLAAIPDETRLREDIGVDSLTLAEAAFKLDELLGVPIETRETAELKSVGELHSFLCAKLGLSPATPIEA